MPHVHELFNSRNSWWFLVKVIFTEIQQSLKKSVSQGENSVFSTEDMRNGFV